MMGMAPRAHVEPSNSAMGLGSPFAVKKNQNFLSPNSHRFNVFLNLFMEKRDRIKSLIDWLFIVHLPAGALALYK